MKNKTLKFSLLLAFFAYAHVAVAQQSRGEQADTSKEEEPTIVEIKPRIEDSTKVPVDESTVYMVVEDMPKFPGGEEAMYKFIAKKIKYPKEARNKNIQGRVIIQFVIDEKGNVIEAKVLRGIGYGCDEEALRVINSMPKWKPGKQRGKNVKVRYVMPIRFVLN